VNVMEALAARHSVRVFRSDPLPKTLVEEVLTAATQTPSWANTQSWEVFAAAGEPLEHLRRQYLQRFEIGEQPCPDISALTEWTPAAAARTAELRAERAALLGLDLAAPEGLHEFSLPNYRFYGAPVVVFLGFERSLLPWALYDLGALSQSIMLAALQLGIDSIPSYSLVLYSDLVHEVLGIPQDVAVAVGIALGYRDDEAVLNSFRSRRRPPDDAIRLLGF